MPLDDGKFIEEHEKQLRCASGNILGYNEQEGSFEIGEVFVKEYDLQYVDGQVWESEVVEEENAEWGFRYDLVDV